MKIRVCRLTPGRHDVRTCQVDVRTLHHWLGKGNTHTHHPIPLVLAGGAQGYFAMGRYLDFDDLPPNRLLVSVCHYMGLEDQDTFGNLDEGSGPLEGLAQ